MAAKSYDERIKELFDKYGIGEEEPPQAAPSSQGTTGTTGNSYSAKRDELFKKYGIGETVVDDDYITSFLTDADQYSKSHETDWANLGWGNSATTYETRKQTGNDLSHRSYEIRNYLDSNKDLLPEEYTAALYEYLDSFDQWNAGSLYSYYGQKKFYSQFDSEEAYIHWDAFSTPEKRQQRYAENQARLEELKAERDKIVADQGNWWLELIGSAASGNSNIRPFAQDTSEIDKEIEAIETEMNLYERGGTDERGFDYGFKTEDDYGTLKANDDFASLSALRNFENADKAALDAYDASQSEGSLALNNGGYYDDEGNIRNAEGEIVQYASAPEVQDKLGLFLSASDEEIGAAYNILSASGGNYETTWADLIQEGETSRWKYLTDDEIGIYYYLMNTQGQEKAYEYLDAMEIELGRRETNEFNAYVDGASGWEKFGLSALSVPMTMIGGVAGTVDNISNLLQGEETNPYSRAHFLGDTGNYIRSSTASSIDEWTGHAAIPGLDYTLGDAYQAGMSMVDSLVGGKIGGKAYQVIMGMGAASSEATRLYDQGASMEQVVLGSVAAGAAEYIFEKFSIENLISMKSPDTFGQFIKNALIQGGIEMSEEAATELSNIITNGLIMQNESDWAKVLEENGGNYGAAVGEMAIRIANAGLSGFLSGVGSGGIQQGMEYAGQQKVNAEVGRYISGANSTDALRSLAMEMAGNTSGSAQNRLTSQNNRLDSGFLTERGRNRATGRLYNTVRSVATEQNTEEISKALLEKGLSKNDAAAIASALATEASGIGLTDKQINVLEKYRNNTEVQQVISEVMDNEESGVNKRARSIVDFEFNTMLNHITSRMNQAAPGQEKKSGEGNLPAKENAVSYEVSEDGKTHIISDPGKEVSVKGIASMDNGKVMLRLDDGSSVAAEDVSFGNDDQALVYSTVADMGVSLETGNALVRAFDADNGVPANIYALDIQEAYNFGEYNYEVDYAKDDPYASVKKQAWNDGRIAAIKASSNKQSDVEATFQKAQETLKQTGKQVRGEYHATLDKGVLVTKLTESQKASYQLADKVAQAAKVDILVYAGKNAEWGYYNPKTDQINLNLNAIRSEKSMMAFTLGHELVHRARKGSPDKYQAFADFLVQEYGRKGASLKAMIGEQIQAAEENGIEMTRDEAFEEVVAEACQRMLLDTDAGKRLAEFGAQSKQNKSFLEDLKRWISEFMEKLRNLFKDVEPDSMAAREFTKFDEGVKQILADMFVDMTIDAGEHLSVIQSAFGKNTEVMTNDQGEFTMAQNADGSEKIFNLVTWKNGGRETLEATLLREGYTKEEVKAALTIMDGKQQLVESIAREVNEDGAMAFPEQGRINEATLTTDIKTGNAVLSALVSNGDYPVNIDLLMVCKKRKAYQRVINRLCETGMIQQATVDALAIAEINKILGKYGFETACLGCFVESRRLRIQEWAQTIVKEWNGEVKKRNPNAKAFGFGKGEATLTADEVMQLIGELESGGKKNDKGNLNLGQGSAVKRMGVLLDKVPSLRRTLSVEDLITPDGLSALRQFDGNLFSMVKSRYGSNSPKFVQEFNPYNHELAKYGTVPSEYKSLREYLYAIGGARMQSFSDFIVENWFDYCQIVADLAVRKLPMHTYTKEIALAKLFGMTGIKINMSLIPDIDRSLGKEYAGLTRNSKGELELIWADKDRFKATGGTSYMQSINFADAVALQEDPRYSSNVGTIAVGISDKHIQMMLADPRIRMVIPYHSSGMNPIFADMMGTSYYKDYTNFQNTTVKQLYNSKGQPVSLKLDKTQVGKLTGGFLFNTVLQELGDARAAAEAYKEWCADSSLHTITIKGETYTAELTPKFNDFAGEENYYKLLEDFNTYDCITEQAAPQGDVQQVYPEGFEDILRAELKGQERYRQKQEKNQAFDKAMGEIESYLQNHTKADTVYYAEQHGIKLGAKDKKLSAADKARLKQLQQDGVRRKLPVGDSSESHNHMARVISSMKQDKVYASTVVSMLKGKGVDAQDIGWSGIEAWLEGKTYVTKKDLMKFAESCFSRDNISENVYDIRYNKAERHKDLVAIGEMPSLYNKLFGFTGNVYVSNDHLYQNMVSKAEAIAEGRPPSKTGADYHELGEEKVIDAIMCFQNPIAIMESLNDFAEPRLVSILDEKGNDKNNLLAVLELYADKTAYGVSQERNHVLFTIYEKSSLPDYVKATAEKNRMLYIRKGASSDTEASLQSAGAISRETLSDNLARFLKKVNDFREKNHIDYKLPVGADTSPRALLANAFEGVVQDDTERRKLQEYKSNVDMLNAEEAKLEDLRAEIHELSFAKGPRDTKRISELKFEAMHTENRINTLDKMLLRFEASAPLQNILQREKEMVRKRERERVKAAAETYRKKGIETMEKREARLKLQKLVLDTAKWISYPKKDDVKCPDLLKAPYADFLNGIDLSSQRVAKGGDPTKNDLKLANAMGSLATALERITMAQDPNQDAGTPLDSGYLDLPAGFVQKLRDMTENIKALMVDGEYVINNMTAAEVRQLSQLIRTLNHAIKEMSTLYANLRFANIETLGDNSMQFMDDLGEIEKTSSMRDFVEWENALPYYAFRRFGSGGESIFEGLMDAQDKLAFLAQQMFAFQEKTWNGKEAKAWSEDTHTINLPSGGKLTLTSADAMSIYCLSRRPQGLQHLLGGGARVVGIQKGSNKAKDSRSILSIQDIDAINSSLTDKQRKVAETIQEFMSTVCSDWGNEISMKRFLTREFTEKNYFPIESNDENLPTKDPAAQQSDLFRLLNISATKPIDPRANNEVIIRNIFDVFTSHASDMARLNAFGLPLLDYMKWLNYREKTVNEEGQIKVSGVRKSMERAYGNAAKSYVLNLIKDVNGRASDGGDPSILMKWMRTAKTASVGSSLRVATLQLTSYPRAALVLSPQSLALGLTKKPNIERAKKYCGIALWKSFGFYDTNISRTIEEQMKGVTDVRQKIIELSLKGAELGDAVTWGAMWNACEYEVAKDTKNKIGSEEFYQEVGNKLREVVYSTQVVDSTLTRSQIMRSKRGMAQEAAAFMSEPTLSANILMDAGFQFNAEKRRTGSTKNAWSNSSKYIGRALAVYAIGQLTAALLESLWDAWRDEEDDEFKDKYRDAFIQNLVLDLVPFNKIPIVSDVFEAALSMFDIGFYSSDRMATTWLTQAVSAVDAWKDVLGGNSSTTVYNALYKSMRAVSSFLGVSISGVMREGVALWNNTVGAYDSTKKIRSYEPSKAEKAAALLDAIIEGDNRQADSLRAEFEDEEAVQSAMRSAIKARYTSGEIDTSTALKYLVLYGGMDAGDARWKVDEWDHDMTGSEEEFRKYNEFFEAVRTGKDLTAVIQKYTDNGVKMTELRSQITSHFMPEYIEMSASDRAGIKGYIINAMVACGIDREDAESKVAAWDFEAENGFTYSDRKTAYINGEITADQLRKALINHGGYTAEDADAQIQVYDLEAKGYEIATVSNVKKYNLYCKPYGVPIDAYFQIVEFSNNTENDVDPDTGKSVSYSAVKKIMAEINTLPISNEQKTAIAMSMWKESTVNKYKLW